MKDEMGFENLVEDGQTHSQPVQSSNSRWTNIKNISIIFLLFVIFILLVACLASINQTKSDANGTNNDLKEIHGDIAGIQRKVNFAEEEHARGRVDNETVIHEIRKQILVLTGWYQASNKYWYKLFRKEVTYGDAKSSCVTKGARLATVGMRNSSARSEILERVVKTGETFTWIGLDNLDGSWKWLDGVESNQNNTEWLPGEPNNHDGLEECGHLFLYWKVNDTPCYGYFYYLCEILHESEGFTSGME